MDRDAPSPETPDPPARGAPGRTILPILTAAAVLLWPLAWNRFPLVYWDTSEYLYRWSHLRPTFDRPIFYSLWLSAFRPAPFGLFLAAAAQALVAAWLLAVLAAACFPARRSMALFLMTAVVAGSPTVLHLNTLMPDATTLWLGLALPVILLSDSATTAAAAGVLLFLSLTFHASHPAILILASPGLILALILSRRPAVVRPAVIISLAMAATLLALCWNSHLQGTGFRPTSPAVIFLAGRMNQGPQLADGLRRVGDASPPGSGVPYFAFARELDAVPRTLEGLLWDDRSPLNERFPHWRTDPDDYRAATAFLAPAVRLVLREQLLPFLGSGLANARSLAQGRHLLGGYIVFGPDTGVGRSLGRFWPQELPRFLRGRQSLGEVPRRALAGLLPSWKGLTMVSSCLALIIGVLGAFLALVPRGRRFLAEPARTAAFLLATVYLADLLVCGLLTSPASRLAERVVALPLAAAILWAASRRSRPTRSTLR